MRSLTYRPLAAASVILAATVALAACGGSESSDDSSSADGGARYGTAETTGSTTTTEAPASGAGTVKLSADPGGALAFVPTTLTAKAGAITLDMANPQSAGIPHAVAIDGGGVDEAGPTVQPGGSSKVTATLEPGTYTFYCPVPGHREGGMEGTLTVS